MDYQVWIKEEFGDTYTKVDCGDLAAAKREIDKAYQGGKCPILTVEVPYSLSFKVEAVGTEKPHRKGTVSATEIEVKEESKSEANQGEAGPGESTGAEGEGEVRPGDLGAVPELDKGSGDPGAGDRVPGK